MEVLALDRGPGIGNLDQCLRDGFSTAGSSGQGMGAVVRLSNASDFYSTAQKGMASLAGPVVQAFLAFEWRPATARPSGRCG